MARIAISDRADMNAEQARAYDAAKQSSSIVGGPYYACIRLPNYQQIVNIATRSERRQPDREQMAAGATFADKTRRQTAPDEEQTKVEK